MDICKIPTTEDQPLPSQNKGMKRPSDQEYKRNDKKLYTGWALNPFRYATVVTISIRLIVYYIFCK